MEVQIWYPITDDGDPRIWIGDEDFRLAQGGLILYDEQIKRMSDPEFREIVKRANEVCQGYYARKRILQIYFSYAGCLKAIDGKWTAPHVDMTECSAEKILEVCARFDATDYPLEQVDVMVIGSARESAMNKLYPQWGYVYLLQSPSKFWKIGHTKYPDDRLHTFGVKLPFEVEYAHLIKCNDRIASERALHRRYGTKRADGEWFALDSDDVAAIKSIVDM